jgi:hypothetical protein
MVSSTNILVQYKAKQNVIMHLAYSVERCLFNRLELKEKETSIFQDSGQIQKQRNIDHHNASLVANICHLLGPPYFSLVKGAQA